jgi:hypothetical protein
VPLETSWRDTLGHSDYGLQRLSGFEDRCVYTFQPVTGRYVRIVADSDDRYARLQEVQVFGLAP